MVTSDSLDVVVERKVKPMLDEAMRAYLGVRVDELSAEVSDKLRKSPLLEITADISLPFKKSKLLFKKAYLIRLIQTRFGNISEVAKLSGIDRRSVHRLVRGLKLSPDRARKELHRQEFYVESEVKSILQGAAESYKSAFAPDRYKAFYEAAPVLSGQIAKQLPFETPTMEQAEYLWERRYLEAALKEYGPSVVVVARKIGLRYETLHRKLKKHGLA